MFSHNRQANADCLSDWASELITLLFDQVEDQWKLRVEALHGRDDAEHSLSHRALLCAKATRLYTRAETLLALDRPILSRPLTTILDLSTTGLEAWISQAEPSILRCISDANDNHVQANTIDDFFPAIAMARNSGLPPLGLSHGALTGCRDEILSFCCRCNCRCSH
jgi:hypothetical protein